MRRRLLSRALDRLPCRSAPEAVEGDGPRLGLAVAIDAIFEIGAPDQPGIAEWLRWVQGAPVIHYAIEVGRERLAVEPTFDIPEVAGNIACRHDLRVQPHVVPAVQKLIARLHELADRDLA